MAAAGTWKTELEMRTAKTARSFWSSSRAAQLPELSTQTRQELSDGAFDLATEARGEKGRMSRRSATNHL